MALKYECDRCHAQQQVESKNVGVPPSWQFVLNALLCEGCGEQVTEFVKELKPEHVCEATHVAMAELIEVESAEGRIAIDQRHRLAETVRARHTSTTPDEACIDAAIEWLKQGYEVEKQLKQLGDFIDDLIPGEVMITADIVPTAIKLITANNPTPADDGHPLPDLLDPSSDSAPWPVDDEPGDYPFAKATARHHFRCANTFHNPAHTDCDIAPCARRCFKVPYHDSPCAVIPEATETIAVTDTSHMTITTTNMPPNTSFNNTVS